MPFEKKVEKINIVDTDMSEGGEICDNSVELIRKCPQQETINTSWDRNFVSFYENKEKTDYNKSPPFVSAMATDDPSSTLGNSTNSSTQTEPFVTLPLNCSIVDVSLSFGKDFIVQNTTSTDTSEQCLRSKRSRRNSSEGDHNELRPFKKQCSDSCSSSVSDLTEAQNEHLSSNSDVSFKSINSNHSFKVRKRRMKSDSNLFRDALQRSRKSSSFSKHHEKTTLGGTPLKERSHRRNNKPQAWKFVDLWAWIGRKGYQSITGLYSDVHREPIVQRQEKHDHSEELRELRKFIVEVDKKYDRLAQENASLKEGMKKMMDKIEQLEGKLRKRESPVKTKPQGPPPPPPPPPPPLPPTIQPPVTKLPVRSHTLPRCGSAPPRVAGPHLTITPQDIANVKLRKTRDNPVRSKPVFKDGQQPLVTQQMLQNTRAKLGRGRPVAASTPKQQLTELEKCLLQESTVTSLYRRRVARNTFRSAEELRPRPYPTARCSRSPHSPRSPRANSLPRVTPMSPLKYPNGSAPHRSKLNNC